MSLNLQDLAEQEMRWISTPVGTESWEVNAPRDYRGACERLGIKSKNRPHLELMRQSGRRIPLMWGQVIAIDALLQSREEKKLRGAILAHNTGYGKSKTSAGFLLADYARHNKIQATLTPNLQSLYKPTLLVVPAHLLEEWENELHVLSDAFKVYLYEGYHTLLAAHANTSMINEALTRAHDSLQASNEFCKIILTSFETLAQHHCSATRSSEEQKLDSKDEIHKTCDIKLRNGDGDLSGVFSTVIVDEAQTLRNTTSVFNMSIRELEADFHILICFPPFSLGYEELPGFMAVMQKKEDDHLRQHGGGLYMQGSDPWRANSVEHKRVRQTAWATEVYITNLGSTQIADIRAHELLNDRLFCLGDSTPLP